LDARQGPSQPRLPSNVTFRRAVALIRVRAARRYANRSSVVTETAVPATGGIFFGSVFAKSSTARFDHMPAAWTRTFRSTRTSCNASIAHPCLSSSPTSRRCFSTDLSASLRFAGGFSTIPRVTRSSDSRVSVIDTVPIRSTAEIDARTAGRRSAGAAGSTSMEFGRICWRAADDENPTADFDQSEESPMVIHRFVRLPPSRRSAIEIACIIP